MSGQALDARLARLELALLALAAGTVVADGDGGFTVATPVPTGVMVDYAGSTAPNDDWLLCDGTAVSRTTYAALFAVIGTTYGAGNGTTTFNLPDCRGRVRVGYDASQTEFDALGETGGANTHTLTTAQIPPHGHVIQRTNQAATTLGADASANYVASTNTGTTYTSTQETGGGEAHNNLQPYVVVNQLIRV